MPKCNTVLQSENDLFEPEIQPDSYRKLLIFGSYSDYKILKMFWALSS